MGKQFNKGHLIRSASDQPLGALRKEYTALGYKAARVERRSAGPRPHGGSEDLHLRHDRDLLIRIADRFMRDNGIYKGILNRFIDSVLGARGFTLDLDYGKRLNKQVMRRWSIFTQQPEVRGMFTWGQSERLALQSLANHGDVGAIHTRQRLFQFVEAEEIGGSNKISASGAKDGQHWESGVLLDRVGKPIAYRIHDRTPNGHVRSGRGRRIAAKDFTFMANRERFSQTRGVPILVSIFAMVNRISDVCDAEAVAWQNLAKFALTVTRNASPELAYTESVQDSDGIDPANYGGVSQPQSSTESDADLANRVMELEEGILFFANPGESIQGIDRKLPGKNFPESVRMFLRLIGMPLGIPLEVILLDYSQTNYTSARASLEQAYRLFQVWQNFMRTHWHTPLFKQWLDWEVRAGTLPANRKIQETIDGSLEWHNWIASEFPWIDHLKEAEAWGKRLDRGLATQTMALQSTNMDFDRWGAQREREVREAIERADRINAEHPEANVDWRMFAAVEVSKTQGMSGPSVPSGRRQRSDAGSTREPAAEQQGEEMSRGHMLAQQFQPEVPVAEQNPRIVMPQVEIRMEPTFNLEIDRVEAGDVNAGAVNAGDVMAGDVSAGDVKAGEVTAGDVSAGDVNATGEVQTGPVSIGDVQASGPVNATGPVQTGQVNVDATINVPSRSGRRLRVERQGGPFGPVQGIVEEGE